jgi:hypothetical protein
MFVQMNMTPPPLHQLLRIVETMVKMDRSRARYEEQQEQSQQLHCFSEATAPSPPSARTRDRRLRLNFPNVSMQASVPSRRPGGHDYEVRTATPQRLLRESSTIIGLPFVDIAEVIEPISDDDVTSTDGSGDEETIANRARRALDKFRPRAHKKENHIAHVSSCILGHSKDQDMYILDGCKTVSSQGLRLGRQLTGFRYAASTALASPPLRRSYPALSISVRARSEYDSHGWSAGIA